MGTACAWEDNIKMERYEEEVDWIQLDWNRVQWRANVHVVIKFQVPSKTELIQ